MDYDHSEQIVIWETVLAQKIKIKINYMGNGTHRSNRLEMDPIRIEIHYAIAFDMWERKVKHITKNLKILKNKNCEPRFEIKVNF